MKKKKWKKVVIPVAICLIGVVGTGIILAQKESPVDFEGIRDKQQPTVDSKEVYPTNGNGQTYGGVKSGAERVVFPDLMRAEGEDGVTGYVVSADLQKSFRESAENPSKIIVLPLYKKDGKTIIGKLKADGNSANY